MSKRILQKPPHGGKPNPTRIPAKIPDTNWLHAGALARHLLAEAVGADEKAGDKAVILAGLEEEIQEGAFQ